MTTLRVERANDMALNVTWDREVWLYLPAEFPHGPYPDEDAWIATILKAHRQARWNRQQRRWLEEYLRGLRANNRVGAHRFAYFVDLRKVLLSVDVFEGPHDPHSTLHDITGSDGIDTDARPPVVVDIVAQGLGPGTRVERALTVPMTTHERIGPGDGATEVIVMVFWVFRSEEADVVITATKSDPAVLAAALPDIEALIDGIAVEPDEEETP
jgi:hypothetical protein